MLKDLNNQILCCSLFLLPFTFILGIAITEITVFFITIYFFLKNRNLEYFKDKKIQILFLFSIYLAIHAYINIQDNLKISSIFYFRYILFLISINYILENLELNKKHNLKNIFYLIVIILFIIFFDTIYQYLTGKNFLGYEITTNRISSFFGSEYILGSFLLKFFPVFLWFIYYFELDLKKHSKLIITIFAGFFISIYLSGERTSFGLLLISLICFVLLIQNLRKIIYISFSIFLLFISTTLYTGIGKSDLLNRIFIKTFNQMTSQVFTQKQEKETEITVKEKSQKIIKNFKIFSEDHHGHYKLAYNLFLDEPIFGTGPRGFRYYCRNIDYDPDIGICSTHPHNIILQFLSEIGLVGFSFYLFVIFYVILKAFRISYISNKNSEIYCFLIASIGIIVYLFPFLPSGNFFNNWISISNYYLIALYFYSYKKVFNKNDYTF